MTAQKPLVIISGQVQQLPAGDTLDAAASEVDVVAMTNANVGAIVIGTPVYVSVAGSVDKANASAAGSAHILGLVRDASIASSASGYIQTDGILVATTGQWDAVAGTTGGLVAGTVYFLSATAGLLSATAPTGSGKYIMRVGLALSTTELDIDTELGGVLLA